MIDRIRIHAPALVLALAVVLERPEQRPVDIGAVAGLVEIGAQPRRGLRVDRERVAAAALARHAQRVIAAVLVQVADLERGDLGAAQPDLQPDRQDRAIAQPGDRVLARQVEQFPRLRFFEKAVAAPSPIRDSGRATPSRCLKPSDPFSS